MPGFHVSDSAANQDLLGYLRTLAMPARPGDPYAYDGRVLRTHPDLIEVFTGLAGSYVVPVHGVPAIVHKGVVVAVAIGTGTMLFRLPEPPSCERDPGCEDLESAGWYAVSAWQPGLATLLQQARDNLG